MDSLILLFKDSEMVEANIIVKDTDCFGFFHNF